MPGSSVIWATEPSMLAPFVAPAMMWDMATTEIRGPLVGRAEELDRLAGLVGLGAAEGAQSGSVLLSG